MITYKSDPEGYISSIDSMGYFLTLRISEAKRQIHDGEVSKTRRGCILLPYD
jgi:hypothetical protein